VAADGSPLSREALATALIRKLRARDEVDEQEAEILRQAISGARRFEPGRVVVRSGVMLSECTLLVEGFLCRFKDLADGQRQIMELHVPGDFVDLHSFLLKRLEHNIGSLTPALVAAVPHEAVRAITENYPHLARMLWFSTLLDAAIHREKILSVGRRSAIARVAHFFCELYVRLGVIGETEGFHYRLPITQIDIADATGLTSVHVNRMLRKLRDEDLITFRAGEVTIQDWEGLQQVAEFDPTYLFLEKMPR
jgi:CRP-like cAMP-binding protein